MTVALILSSFALVVGAVVIAQASVVLRRDMRRLTTSIEKLAGLPGKVDLLQSEVATGNTKTIGGLAALAEGRRIEVDVEPGDRTAHEQGYVDHLKDDEK